MSERREGADMRPRPPVPNAEQEACCSLPLPDLEVVAAEQEIVEVHPLGPCASSGCGGTINKHVFSHSGRVQVRQRCTNDECSSQIPAIIEGVQRRREAMLPDMSPPDFLGGIQSGEDLAAHNNPGPHTLGEIE